MNLDETWRGLDAGLSTRTQEGPFKCAPMADRRVSRAEQGDYMPPVGAPSRGEVLFLLAPIVLCLVGAGALIVSFIR